MKKIALFVLLSLLVPQQVAFAASAVLTWVDNSGNNAAVNDQETGFVVERQLNGGAWSTLGQTLSNVVTYTDNTLLVSMTVDNNYCYRVSATNTAGTSAPSNVACKLILKAPLVIPPAVTGLTAK